MSWAVTGMGAVTSTGAGVPAVFDALCAGRSGCGPLRGFDRSRYETQHAYELDDRPVPGADVPFRATKLLLAAVAEAVRDAGLGDRLDDVPILVGTGLRELRSVELWWRDGVPLTEGELHFGGPLRERFGTTRTWTLSNACSASLYALALAGDLLDAGAADVAIAAGVDVITESMFGLVDRANPANPTELRPFDRDRRGVLMGDGAAAVVLRRAGAGSRPPHGLVRAVGLTCDAVHVTAPAQDGVAAAIRDAHSRGGIKPQDVDLLMLHGTGTVLNDEAEAAAVAEVFGPAVGRPLMTAIKSLTGHTSGASGLIGLVAALRSLATGRVPPVVGLAEPIDDARLFRFAIGGTEPRMEVAQVNAFGFGGVNAVAVVEAAP